MTYRVSKLAKNDTGLKAPKLTYNVARALFLTSLVTKLHPGVCDLWRIQFVHPDYDVPEPGVAGCVQQ